MCRTDRQFDPFTETVIDGMVAASVTVKVIKNATLTGKFISSLKLQCTFLPNCDANILSGTTNA